MSRPSKSCACLCIKPLTVRSILVHYDSNGRIKIQERERETIQPFFYKKISTHYDFAHMIDTKVEYDLQTKRVRLCHTMLALDFSQANSRDDNQTCFNDRPQEWNPPVPSNTKHELKHGSEFSKHETHVFISNPAVLYVALRANPMIVLITSALAVPQIKSKKRGMTPSVTGARRRLRDE